LRRVGAVHERKGYFTGENCLNAAGARWDVNQLDIQAIFLKQPFLLRHEHTALSTGYCRPVDTNRRLGEGWDYSNGA
jgi:hypothetical protein